VKSGKLTEDRVDLSVKRLLKEQFELGLFENPYVDPNRAAYLVGNPSFQRKADIAQRKSIVLLKNEMNLPLTDSKKEDTLKLFTIGINHEMFNNRNWSRFKAVSGDYEPSQGETMGSIPEDVNYAIIRVNVANERTRARMFGGASPDELNMISFTEMAKAKSWKITPSLEDINKVMNAVGPEKTIISIDFRQPYVLDKESGILNAGAILATFSVSDEAIMDVITGKFKPAGKLPFALANKLEAVIDQDPDAPGYPEEDTLFSFGFGLTYD
jgi:beta-glucosidase